MGIGEEREKRVKEREEGICTHFIIFFVLFVFLLLQPTYAKLALIAPILTVLPSWPFTFTVYYLVPAKSLLCLCPALSALSF